RWAERTSNSYGIPCESSSSSAGCIRSRSESEPTRMPTSGASAADMPLGGGERDVLAEPHPGERDPAHGLVGGRASCLQIVADPGHVEDATAVRDELVSASGGPRMEDERSGRLGVVDPFDRCAAVPVLRVLAARDD